MREPVSGKDWLSASKGCIEGFITDLWVRCLKNERYVLPSKCVEVKKVL